MPFFPQEIISDPENFQLMTLLRLLFKLKDAIKDSNFGNVHEAAPSYPTR